MFVYLKFGVSKTDRENVVKVLRDFARLNPAPHPDPGAAPTTAATPEPLHSSPPPAFPESLLAYLDRDIRADELEKAFGWNLETYTGFRDLKPEQMSTNIYSRTIDVMGKIVESLAKMKTTTKD